MRLFVALDVPEQVRHALAKAVEKLKPRCKSARWTRLEGVHITLKFIGYVDEPKVAAIRAALGSVHSPAPVEMDFRGVGFFPTARSPRVFWCGVRASENLAPLAADIERALEPLGIAREERDFIPHLTLARFESPRDARDLAREAESLADTDFGSTRETEFHLYESILKRSGAEYRRVESYSFLVKGAA